MKFNIFGSCYTRELFNYLEELSHNQDPWIYSREGLDPDERSDKTISKESISNYFINDIFQPDAQD